MSDLLIHSMTEFSDLIFPCLARAGARRVVEIGAEFGGMSQRLAAHCEERGGTFVTIDPAPKREFLDWVAASPHVEHKAATSLSVIPSLAGADAWVIDGDHNYFTVHRELQLIDAQMRKAGRPLLAFLHDVSWPCARRDFYYAPETIPDEERQPYTYDGGVTLGFDGCLHGRGMRGMGQFAWAKQAGGPRNGVLTAVEDFLEEARAVTGDDGQPRQIAYAHIPAVLGLGVIFDCNAEWSADVADLLAPYHENALLKSLERNRLRNWLSVIDLQDRMATTRGAA